MYVCIYILAFEHCALGGTSQRWSFALGFPSQSLFDALSPAFTVNTLINKYPQLQISACEKEACPSASPDKAVTPPPPAEHSGHYSIFIYTYFVVLFWYFNILLPGYYCILVS